MYGTFSQGLDDNDLPYHWNQDVIGYYGYTNRGVSGLILSIKYSIGYLSAADADEMGITYAYLENKNGSIVPAGVCIPLALSF